jgi:hypothetical protein
MDKQPVRINWKKKDFINEAEPFNELVGIWDTNKSPISLGGLLIFIAELLIQKRRLKTLSVDIFIIDSSIERMIKFNGLPERNHSGIRQKKAVKKYPFLAIINEIEGIKSLRISPSIHEINELIFKGKNRCPCWPIDFISEGYQYGTTLFIQKLVNDKHPMAIIRFKAKTRFWAKKFLKDNSIGKLPVIVHLKNNKNCSNCSNADFDQWYSFFRECRDKYPVKFFIIGNEPVDKRFYTLDNVVITQKLGLTLIQDLSLIGEGTFFMGMSSGPCNIAVFNSKPYAIFKNPDHDAEQMKTELGDNDRLSFSSPLQNFLRVNETKGIIMSEFLRRYNIYLKNDNW